MDTNLGIISLNKNQIDNSFYLTKPEPFTGFIFYSNNSVVGVSEIEPTDDQKSIAVSWLTNLSQDKCQEVLNLEFNFKTLMGRINQVLPPLSVFKLAPYTGALESYCQWYNWSGVNGFLVALQTAGTATDEDVTSIKQCFSEQGINIDSYV